jgi:hypothetical protein
MVIKIVIIIILSSFNNVDPSHIMSVDCFMFLPGVWPRGSRRTMAATMVIRCVDSLGLGGGIVSPCSFPVSIVATAATHRAYPLSLAGGRGSMINSVWRRPSKMAPMPTMMLLLTSRLTGDQAFDAMDRERCLLLLEGHGAGPNM